MPLADRPALAAMLVATGLALGACKVEERDTGTTAAPDADTKPDANAEGEPVTQAPNLPEGAGVELLFAGSRPALPAAIAKLHAGQRRDEVRELVPAMRPTERPKYASLEDPGFPGVTWSLRFDDGGDEGRLLSATAELDKRQALGLAKRKWGAPQTVTDGMGRTTFFWFDEDAGLRASLNPRNEEDKLRLEFLPYVSSTELLADDLLGVRSGALLGLTRAEIEAAHGPGGSKRLRRFVDKDGGWTAHLWYPATTWNPQPSLVRLDAEAGGDAVTRVRFELPFLYLAKLRAELYAELVDTLGEPVRGDGEAESGARFETETVAVEATIERGRWMLAATAKAKAEAEAETETR